MSFYIQPYDWFESDIGRDFVIRIWAHTEESERVCVIIDDFPPFALFELPDIAGIDWTLASVRENVRTQLSRVGSSRVDEGYERPLLQFGSKNKLYFNNDRKSHFIKATFRNLSDMRYFSRLVTDYNYVKIGANKISLKRQEADIPMTQQLIASYGLSYSGWHLLENAADITDPIYKLTSVREFRCSKHNISYHSEMIAETYPVIAAVDIETYTPKFRSGVYPNKVLQDNCVFMISLVIQRYKDPQQVRYKYIFSTADCLPNDEFEFIKCSSEYDMFCRLFSMIIDLGVTVVIGYNIFSYDYDYIYARLGVKGNDRYFAGQEYSLVRDGLISFKEYVLDTPMHGNLNLFVPQMEGIVNIDLMHIIKVEYNLGQYSLDAVSQHFLDGAKKADMSYDEMFLAYHDWLHNQDDLTPEMLEAIYKVAYYNMIDSDLCIRLMEKLNQWTAMIEQSSIFNVRLEDIHLRGQQIRVRNKVHNMCARDGLVLDRVRFPGDEFTGAAVFEPLVGLYENVLVLDFNSLYPSIIIAYNVCYSTYIPELPEYDGYDETQCHIITWQENDIQHRARFLKPEYKQGILPRLCDHYIQDRKRVRALISPHNENYQNEILNQRQLALKYSNNSLYGVLGTRRGTLTLPPGAAAITAIGRISNSLAANYVRDNFGAEVIYGDTDSIMIRLAHMNNPQEIMAMGHTIAESVSSIFDDPLQMEFDEMLAIAFFVSKKRYIGFKAFVAPQDEPIHYYGSDISHLDPEVSRDMVPKYHLYETQQGQVYAVMASCTEPSMVGILYSPEKHSFCRTQMIVKGLLTARRDNNKWQRDIYSDVMHMILHGASREEMYQYIDDSILRILYCQVPIEDLILRAKLKDHSTGMINKFSERLRSRGVMFNSDDSFEYLYHRVPPGQHALTNGERIETPDYVIENLGVDREFYVSRMTKPIDPVVAISYPLDEHYQKLYDAQDEGRAVKSRFIKDSIVRRRKKMRNGTIQVTYWNRPYGLYPTNHYWDLWERTIRRRRAVMTDIHKHVTLVE